MATQSVVTAIRCLEGIAEHGNIGLSELSRNTGFSKATLLRALATLEELRWVQQSAPPLSTWSLTVHAHRVTSQGQVGSTLREAAMPQLNGLQLDTGETIHLCQPDGDVLVVTERLDSSHALRAFLALGTRIPLHASGTGLAYLSAQTEGWVRRYLDGPLERRTRLSLAEPTEVWAELAAIRARGYSVNEEGLSPGITSLGAPVRDAAGEAVAAISISGPTSRITPARFEDYGTAVRECAGRISAALGYRG